MPAGSTSQSDLRSQYISRNPFTPIFGQVPPYFAGRENIIDDMILAFDHPHNNPDRCSLFVGARGTGKTALLTFLSHRAEERGWICVNTTAQPGMLQEILKDSVEASSHLIDLDENAPRLSGVSIAPIGGVSWTQPEPAPSTWRSEMARLLDRLGEAGAGLLVTVDEVDPTLEEMRRLITAYQHFVREERPIALLMAGLPHKIDGLLSGDSTSFLRRAARHNLGMVPRYDIIEAFNLTLQDARRDIEPDAIEEAADIIGGFPFMLQLLGYRTWNMAFGHDVLTVDDVRRGALVAQSELASRVFDATVCELSHADVEFLKAMAQDDGPSRQADVAKRLRKSSGHVSSYKKRLMDAGVIESPTRGVLRFSLPGFREYILAGAFGDK